jgi:Putative transposase
MRLARSSLHVDRGSLKASLTELPGRSGNLEGSSIDRARLCRYGARPPFSLTRLRVLPRGLVAYRIKKVGAGRAKHRVMTPLELLARLAALVPPPRYPLVRYHGVLAPRSAWRREVVPRPPKDSNAAGAGPKKACSPSSSEEPAAADDREAPGSARGRKPNANGGAVHGARSRAPTSARAGAAGGGSSEYVRPPVLTADRAPGATVEQLTPNILGLRHWSRLLDGLLYAIAPRLRWSQLLGERSTSTSWSARNARATSASSRR